MATSATRKSFGQTLLELGGEYPEIVVLDADLSKSTMSKLFADKYPDRFFEMGISEANMIGVGAGLALAGKKPFACSFACFITGRYDTIRISVAYRRRRSASAEPPRASAIGEDGNSQMGLEDLGLKRGLPNMTVLQPADDIETRQACSLDGGERCPVLYPSHPPECEGRERSELPFPHRECGGTRFGE